MPKFEVGDRVMDRQWLFVHEVTNITPLSKTKLPCDYYSVNPSDRGRKTIKEKGYPQRAAMVKSNKYGDLVMLHLRKLGTEDVVRCQESLVEHALDPELYELEMELHDSGDAPAKRRAVLDAERAETERQIQQQLKR